MTRKHSCALAVLAAAILAHLTLGSTGATAQLLLDPLTQPKFVNPLPAPGVIDATQGGTFEVTMSQFEQWLGLVDPVTGASMMTTVWGYDGSYPGPTFEVRSDVPVDVRWVNGLVDGNGAPRPHLLPVDTSLHWAHPSGWPASGVPTVTHLHGGHTESASDGLPDAWFTPGFDQRGSGWVKETYHYDNDQEAATIWYHDHALGITRLNVYAGLAGFYLIRDDWELSLNLPSGAYEVPIVIQDRMFTADGELYYPSTPEEPGAPDPSVLPEFFGDVVLVNGMAWPYLDVEPRKYRLRFLNGSDSRFYSMWIAGGPMLTQIGTDNGLLYQPVPVDKLTLGPGERADVVVDFSNWAGRTFTLRNNAKSPYPGGETVDPRTAGQLMQFRVSPTPVEDPSSLPAILREEPIEPLGPAVRTRKLLLFEGTDAYGRLQPLLGIVDPDRPDLDGTLLWDEEITENPMVDDIEIWEVYNATMDAHPIHLHLVAFQILGRQKYTGTIAAKQNMQGTVGGVLSDIRLRGNEKPPAANERGWKDTAQMLPGEVTRVIAKFDREGLYVWHCHILSHEDHEMMRPYYVGAMPSELQTAVDDTPAGTQPPVVALEANRPNPFNPHTEIGFLVPRRGRAEVTVYDTAGRVVRKLADREFEAGRHALVWDGRDAGGSPVASGVYIYELRSGDLVKSGKMTLAR